MAAGILLKIRPAFKDPPFVQSNARTLPHTLIAIVGPPPTVSWLMCAFRTAHPRFRPLMAHLGPTAELPIVLAVRQ